MSLQRILIVDDDPISRALVQKALDIAGFITVTASNGGAAIAEFSIQPFDVVILDLEMPGMGGLEVFHQLSKTGIRFKSIILTAHGTLESAIQALRYRVDDYLLKPIQPEKVIQAVEKVLTIGANEQKGTILPSNLDAPTRPTSVIKIGSRLTVDFNRRTITDGNEIVRLTSTEARIFETLVDNLCEVVSYPDLVEQAHGYRMARDESAIILRPVVSRLKKKLLSIPDAEKLIHSVRGTGYILDPESYY